ncbi:hypothetical protein [Salirhabdus salicampi]|uniref:hypothetical protein n=1 Tax=Salirhabdus salicampi TaxID=476102 RepID=UPI0020C52C32|nr:hypothetical protein [Salirhabdus salicampi]MCP8616170.1 hypothetical protein [Salirhabdus salicampi]
MLQDKPYYHLELQSKTDISFLWIRNGDDKYLIKKGNPKEVRYEYNMIAKQLGGSVRRYDEEGQQLLKEIYEEAANLKGPVSTETIPTNPAKTSNEQLHAKEKIEESKEITTKMKNVISEDGDPVTYEFTLYWERKRYTAPSNNDEVEIKVYGIRGTQKVGNNQEVTRLFPNLSIRSGTAGYILSNIIRDDQLKTWSHIEQYIQQSTENFEEQLTFEIEKKAQLHKVNQYSRQVKNDSEDCIQLIHSLVEQVWQQSVLNDLLFGYILREVDVMHSFYFHMRKLIGVDHRFSKNNYRVHMDYAHEQLSDEIDVALIQPKAKSEQTICDEVQAAFVFGHTAHETSEKKEFIRQLKAQFPNTFVYFGVFLTDNNRIELDIDGVQLMSIYKNGYNYDAKIEELRKK